MFTTHYIHNRPIMKVVCCERVCDDFGAPLFDWPSTNVWCGYATGCVYSTCKIYWPFFDI